MKNIEKYTIINNWREDMLKLIKPYYNKVDINTLMVLLDNIIKDNIRVEDISMLNSYLNTEFTTDSLDLTEFYFKRKPLTGGNGVLFDADIYNPSIPMLKGQKATRGKYKKEMYLAHKAGDEFGFKMGNLKQNNEKVKMNAWYGINGTRSSMFFNIHCATAITGKGKQLISTATCAFEGFIADNVKFLNMDDCMIFIKNILSENREFDDKFILDRNITVEECLLRLRDNMEYEEEFEIHRVRKLLYSLNKTDINRIYYKNNLFGFCRNSYVKNILEQSAMLSNDYRTPEPKDTNTELKTILDSLWELLEEYVFYNYQYTEKFYRVQTHKRKAVLVIDTDSNMIYLDPWVNFIKDEVLTKEQIKKKEKESENLNFDFLYCFCYITGLMIKQVLVKYLNNCNVKKENIDLLDMKNEYLFSRMVITDGKKAYASIIEYKEGENMHGKTDIKGLAINKSDTNRNASAIFKNILIDDILKSEDISLNNVLIKISEFEKEIKRSILAGESTYFKPMFVKQEDAYANPLSEQGIRAVICYNAAYPDDIINLPDDFFIVKTTLLKPSDLDKVEDDEIRENIRKYIFENENKKISSKGLYVFALPKDKKVPEWLIPFIDINAMTQSILKAFLPVLKTIGTVIEMTGGDAQVSNYISL